MNIFKVIASGRKRFQEETASAVLAWFLNPYMEHGLGFEFLSRFLTAIQETTNSKDMSVVIEQLSPKLRTEADDDTLDFWCSLEMSVQGAFIDVVLGVDDWIFAIENKIYSASATDHQLVREYEGLKKKLPDKKVGMIYLIPTDGIDSPLDPKAEAIYDELETKNDDFKALITWQDNNLENTPSLASIIREILKDETTGEIEPVPEYSRHTLKALLSFIRNDFAGYDYDRGSSSHSGKNPLTESSLTVQQLKKKDVGYVGVAGGVRGLIRIGREKIQKRQFQYATDDDLKGAPNWLTLDRFIEVINWLVDGDQSNIEWSGKYPAQMIYQIAQDFDIYVGIRGGEPSLRGMSADTIEKKEWGISTIQEGKNSQWIDGKLYCQIMEGKL